MNTAEFNTEIGKIVEQAVRRGIAEKKLGVAMSSAFLNITNWKSPDGLKI